jgi:hypothetical protein
MRLTLPDGSGWFDLLDASALTAAHQDEFWDLQDELRAKRRAELPPPGPDPANPAQMLPEPEVRLTRKDIARIQALAASWVVQATSYAGVLPWDEGSRGRLPLTAWNVLREELAKDGGVFDALNGITPPKPPDGTATSASTSPDGSPPLPTEPALEMSGTPSA